MWLLDLNCTPASLKWSVATSRLVDVGSNGGSDQEEAEQREVPMQSGLSHASSEVELGEIPMHVGRRRSRRHLMGRDRCALKVSDS